MVLIIVLIIDVGLILFFFMMLGRTVWIHQTRAKFLRECSALEYDSLWGYNKMQWHFWIWDFDKMKNETKKTKAE